MLVKQLSIFMENKQGRFTEVAKLLGKEGVNMKAFTVSENSDFGIVRLIVDDREKAHKVLRSEGYAVTETDVICLQCPNVAGALGKIMDVISEANIFIEYMYAFSEGDSANIIIRPDNIQKCDNILNNNNL